MLEGEAFPESPEFFFGPFPATEVLQLDENTYEVVAPPGSPGPSPLRILGADGLSEPLGTFEYTSEEPTIWAFKPTDGADGGGTFLRFFGEGLEVLEGIALGERAVTNLTRNHGAEVTGMSPPGDESVVDVAVSLAGGDTLFEDGYRYYNPSSTFGGTWGKPLDETLNVTVLDGATGEGVEAATVFLDDGLGPQEVWETNELGQVVIGLAGLEGAQVVTALKEGYTAGSVVRFDSTNVIVILYSLTPSPSDPPPPPPEPAVVSGRVIGTSKFSVPPPSACPPDGGRATSAHRAPPTRTARRNASVHR